MSRKDVATFGKGDKEILVVDCGMKLNQLRCFLKRGVRAKVVPWDYDFTNDSYDGLFITNGPGDPTMCVPTIAHIRAAYKRQPTRPVRPSSLGSRNFLVFF